MGYKLAGFDVIGCNEIDEKVNRCYVANHAPKINLLGDIRTLIRERERENYLRNFIIWIFWTDHRLALLSLFLETVKRIGEKKRSSERDKISRFLILFSLIL